MTRVIDAPRLAKATSADDALRELTNELARVRRRLRKAELKLEGLHALKEDLRSRLPAEEYEYLEVKLQREVEQWEKAETELQRRCSDARIRHNYGDETFKRILRGREEIAKRLGLKASLEE